MKNLGALLLLTIISFGMTACYIEEDRGGWGHGYGHGYSHGYDHDHDYYENRWR